MAAAISTSDGGYNNEGVVGELIGWSGTGNFTQSGGTNMASLYLDLGWSLGGSGTYNLDGGLLTAGTVEGGAGTSTFNFNGGTLQALGTTPTSSAA